MVERLLQGVIAMEDSVTYQAIIRKGSLQGERMLLLRQGTKRFGTPTAEPLATFNAITDPTQLDELAVRLLEVGSWQELLEIPDSGTDS